MESLLVDHAHKHVWCAPNQDRRLAVEPARVTRPRGVRGSFFLTRRSYNLPTSSDLYHVFHVGAIGASLFNLPDDTMVWRSLAFLSNDRKLLGRMYTNYGLNVPRNDVWVLLTQDRNILVAVKDNRPYVPVHPGHDRMFFELYSNAWYGSLESLPVLDGVTVFGRTILSQQDRSLMVLTFGQFQQQSGHTYAYINGRLVKRLTTAMLDLYARCEIVRDTSIYRTEKIRVKDLKTFTSTLDSKSKYLVHPDKDLQIGSDIEYKDDLDFWLVKETADEKDFTGYYYHQNELDSVRMLTHRDYAIPTEYVAAFVDDIDEFNSVDELSLLIFFRKSGIERSLLPEVSRIQELYNLEDDEILQAMVGVNSTVPEWKAANLENSAYPEVMRSRYNDIALETVVDAYGYNTIAKTTANVTHKTRSNGNGLQIVTLPPVCQKDSTIFEYDDRGKLTGKYYHPNGETWAAKKPTTRLIEVFQGKSTEAFHQYQGIVRVDIEPGLEYRMYRAPNYPTGYMRDMWEDVTDQIGTDYDILNGQIVWALNPQAWMTCVRSNKWSLFREYKDVVPDEGIFEVIVTENYQDSGEPSLSYTGKLRPAEIPPGKVEIWMDGNLLIPGIDYLFEWPRAIIINKSYREGLSDPPTFHVRCSGFCSSDLEIDEPEETGFVKYGRLSRNSKYNIRDDRVMQLSAGGRTYDQSDLRFEENGDVSGVSLPNGWPYMASPHYVNVGRVSNVDTSTLLNPALDVDERVSNYLTLKLTERDESGPSAITRRHEVYSPFSQTVIWLMDTGFISRPFLEAPYTNQDINTILEDYMWILDFDPTQAQNLPDEEFVAIHPHGYYNVLGLDIYEYRFLERVIGLYLDDKVDLSSFVEMVPYTG